MADGIRQYSEGLIYYSLDDNALMLWHGSTLDVYRLPVIFAQMEWREPVEAGKDTFVLNTSSGVWWIDCKSDTIRKVSGALLACRVSESELLVADSSGKLWRTVAASVPRGGWRNEAITSLPAVTAGPAFLVYDSATSSLIYVKIAGAATLVFNRGHWRTVGSRSSLVDLTNHCLWQGQDEGHVCFSYDGSQLPLASNGEAPSAVSNISFDAAIVLSLARSPKARAHVLSRR